MCARAAHRRRGRPRRAAKCAWPSQWTARVAAAADGDRDRRRRRGTAIGRCVSACGATGTSANAGTCGCEDRAAGRQRVGGRAGGRGDDDAVGAHRVDEAAVDLDRAFDHPAERAAVDDDVVQRQRVLRAMPSARSTVGGEQRAALLDVAAVEHRAERVLHAGERDVGEEAEPALVDADQRHVERRQLARDRQHRAVAAEHDGEVGGGPSASAIDDRIHRRRWAMCAVSVVERDLRGRARRGTSARRDSGSARPGLAWRPTSATRAKRAGRGAGMAAIKPQRVRRSAIGRRVPIAGAAGRTGAGPRAGAMAGASPRGKIAGMLDPRAQHLLKTLVERYIADGQPVGSRALSRHSGLELSPATIRNVMADLEEMGFIASPHTSAGRMPTPKGYRFFVDTLMVMKPLEQGEIHRLEGELTADRPQQLVSAAATAAVAAHALRRRRDDAAAARAAVPPPRVPAAVRAARAADHRHARRRRAEPHPAHRPLVHARRS